jgi:hypothetical protein
MSTQSAAPACADVRVVGGETVFLFLLLSDHARCWIEQHVRPDRQHFGIGLAVEHRYAQALAAGMQNDGVVLICEGVSR